LRRFVAASLLALVLGAACRTGLDEPRVRELAADLGELILVGFHGTALDAELDHLLCTARVGGVVLFARNIEHAEQLTRLTRSLSERAAACAGRRLLIAVDAEGGQVMRLAPDAGWAATLSARELGDENDFTLTELEARRIARRLRETGINWNLAPVVDIGYNPANPVIVGAARAYGANPWLVTEHARAFVRGMHAEGVLTALKHFPGHGSSHGDSHEGFVDVTDTANAEIELLPYRSLIAEGRADAVMTAHVWNRRLDPHYPATLSHATITGLLRGQLGFEGPVVSDDLRMGAIRERYGLAEAAVRALDAGVDLLLLADDRLPDSRSAADVTLAALRTALDCRRLDPERVTDALTRVRAFRGRLP